MALAGAAPIVETGEKRRAFHNIQAKVPVENILGHVRRCPGVRTLLGRSRYEVRYKVRCEIDSCSFLGLILFLFGQIPRMPEHAWHQDTF